MLKLALSVLTPRKPEIKSAATPATNLATMQETAGKEAGEGEIRGRPDDASLVIVQIAMTGHVGTAADLLHVADTAESVATQTVAVILDLAAEAMTGTEGVADLHPVIVVAAEAAEAGPQVSLFTGNLPIQVST